MRQSLKHRGGARWNGATRHRIDTEREERNAEREEATKGRTLSTKFWSNGVAYGLRSLKNFAVYRYKQVKSEVNRPFRECEGKYRFRYCFSAHLRQLLVCQQLRAMLFGDCSQCLSTQKQVLNQDILEVGALLGIETCRRIGTSKSVSLPRFETAQVHVHLLSNR